MAITQLVAIDDYLIDCSLSETHTFDSDVTNYPVESGSNITDNVRPLPIVVEMECLVSNTPIGLIRQYRNLTRGEGVAAYRSKPVDDAYELLLLIREQRKPVTIRTSLRTFENMVLKNLSIPRGAHLDELRFTATFQQIQTVENKRTVRVSTPIAKKGKAVTRAPTPIDLRQVIVDPNKLAWYDPDIGGWRKLAVYKKDATKTKTIGINPLYGDDELGVYKSRWHLYRATIETADNQLVVNGKVVYTKTDPFDTIRMDGTHPMRNLIVLTLNQVVLHGFTIKKSIPSEVYKTLGV